MSISNSFVFVTLRSKKLSLHYVVNISSSAIYCAMEFDKSTIAVSSEYSINIVSSVTVQSFVYNVKRTGDKTLPCGTPVEMDRSSDNTPLNRTDCFPWHKTFIILMTIFGNISKLISSIAM